MGRTAMRIQFIIGEVCPHTPEFSETDVTTALPSALYRLHQRVRIVTPRYRTVRERRFSIREISRLHSIPITFGEHSTVASFKSSLLPHNKVQVYFLDDIPKASATDVRCQEEDPEQALLSAAFLTHGAIELERSLGWDPHLVYCCGHQAMPTAIAIGTMPEVKAFFPHSKVIVQDWGSNPNHKYNAAQLNAVGVNVGATRAKRTLLDWAAPHAAMVIPARSGRSEEAGALLGQTFQQLAELPKFQPNPRDDSSIPINYDRDNVHTGKAANKLLLQKQLGLETNAALPLVAVWEGGQPARMANILSPFPAQVVSLDTPKGSQTHFSDERNRRIVAAADILLYPDRASTNQSDNLASMLYGTVPVVSRAGIAQNIIEDFTLSPSSGTGFHYSSDVDVVDTLHRALECYSNLRAWGELQRRTMNLDFAWDAAARVLLKSLYGQIDHPEG